MTTTQTSANTVPSRTKTVEVTFSLDTSIHAPGDVLAATQVVSEVSRMKDLTCVLSGITLIDEDAQGVELDVVVFSADVALGTENAAVSITDADARQILGIVNVAEWVDLGAVKVATVLNVNLPIKLADRTQNVYVALITRGTPTHNASGIRGRFHFFQD